MTLAFHPYAELCPLTEGQRGMVAARLGRMQHGGDRSKPSIECLPGEKRAEMLKVGRATVERSQIVEDQAPREIVQAVDRGHVRVSTAAELAVLPVESQAEILKNLPRDEAGDLAPEVRKALSTQITAERIKKVAAK